MLSPNSRVRKDDYPYVYNVKAVAIPGGGVFVAVVTGNESRLRVNVKTFHRDGSIDQTFGVHGRAIVDGGIISDVFVTLSKHDNGLVLATTTANRGKTLIRKLK